MQHEDLTMIDKVIEDHHLIERIQNYNKFQALYDLAREYIQANNLILFGGYALNMIFPEKQKFYDRYELPDFDVFAPDAEKHAKALANLYKKKGYNYVDVRLAMHVGSFKVFAEFMPIADLRDVPKKMFDKMIIMSGKQKSDITKLVGPLDFHVAPLEFLRFSVHHEISEPRGEVSRWKKVYSRFLSLHELYPYTYDSSCLKKMMNHVKDPNIRKVLDNIHKYADQHHLPHIGSSAFLYTMEHIGKQVRPYSYLDSSMGCIELLCDTAKQTSEELHQQLSMAFPDQKLVLMQHGDDGPYEHNVPFYTISCQEARSKVKSNLTLAAIHQSVSCHSIIKVSNRKIGNIDTQIRFLFHYIFHDMSKAYEEKRKCMINTLYNIAYDNKYRHKLITTRFNLDCYGYQPSLNSAKRMKLERNKSK
jgi:hypothetical protein